MLGLLAQGPKYESKNLQKARLTNDCVSVSYKEGWPVWQEKKKKRVSMRIYQRDGERTWAECASGRTRRRGGSRLVHWCVTSAACWIEVLCPVDFNPNSLRNREQVPVQTLWGQRESERRRNTTQLIKEGPWSWGRGVTEHYILFSSLMPAFFHNHFPCSS